MVDKLFLVALAVAGFSAQLADEGKLQNLTTQNTINALLGWIPASVAVGMLLISLTIDTKKEYESLIGVTKININNFAIWHTSFI